MLLLWVVYCFTRRLDASLLQVSPDEALEIKVALQTVQLYEKEEELKEKENKLLSLEETIKRQEEELKIKVKKVKKSQVEAKRVAAQLRLTAGQLDHLYKGINKHSLQTIIKFLINQAFIRK